MKAKTRFIKMFSKLPEKARRNLVFDPYGVRPMSLNVMYMEVKNNTIKGDKFLNDLGYTDTEKQSNTKEVKND